MISISRFPGPPRKVEDRPTAAGPFWWFWENEDQVVVRCSGGHDLFVGAEIDDAGLVFPRIACPARGCTFRDQVRLLDWRGGSRSYDPDTLPRAARFRRLSLPPPLAGA